MSVTSVQLCADTQNVLLLLPLCLSLLTGLPAVPPSKPDHWQEESSSSGCSQVLSRQ